MCSAELGVGGVGQRTVLSTLFNWGEEWACFHVTFRAGGRWRQTRGLCYQQELGKLWTGLESRFNIVLRDWEPREGTEGAHSVLEEKGWRG